MKTTLLAGLLATQALTVIALAADTPVMPVVSLITVATNDEGKKLLADSTGKTLYVFDKDKGSSSACNGDCAEVWPPYLVEAAEVPALKAPLGQIERANKKIQLTYQGRPVYNYAFDRGQGADAGDGIGGVWHYIEMK